MERLLLITPCRNEAEHLERTLASVAAQTRPPDLWLIIDDGSTDATPQILDRWAAELPYLELQRSPRHGPRGRDGLATAAEAVAFNQALRSVPPREFSHIGKLDADIELPPGYFQGLLDRFAVESDLGIVGGQLLENHGRGWHPTGGPEHHVRGALKLYSRECLEAIGGGIEERLGWDTIDEVEARMRGYRTRTLSQPAARHLRPVASRGGILRGRARLGRAAFILRYSPWWVALKSARVGLSRPYLLGGVAYFWGYLRAVAGDRRNRVQNPEFARFVAAELRGRARRRGVAQVSSDPRRS
ncbi:MAG TPA: glycosyltransferase family A protein [Solirubrobacterales bacterium]|nr:glycosyltransferase family A protein [Solirubrobacterales bacterium]